jgi:hypothetical protein
MNRSNPIRITIKYPYDNDSFKESLDIWEKIKGKYKDAENAPPFELVYASRKNLIKEIKKNSFCTLCYQPFQGNGLYFPIENNLIIPYGCCETCVSKGKSDEVYVGTYLRKLKYYTWKMVVSANLTDHFYKQVLEEEEAKKKEYEHIVKEYNFVDQNPIETYQKHFIQEDNNLFETFQEDQYNFSQMIVNDPILSYDVNKNYYMNFGKQDKYTQYIIYFVALLCSLIAYMVYNI